MPTEIKSPTTTLVVIAGWLNPTYAYASDNLRTSSATDAAQQEYAGYGFAIPAENTINQVLVKIECYSTDPTNESLALRTWDSAIWQSIAIPMTTTEAIYQTDVSASVNTPAKVNALKTQIILTVAAACFPPDAKFLCLRKGVNLEKIVGETANWNGMGGWWQKCYKKLKAERLHPFKMVPASLLTEEHVLMVCRRWDRVLKRFVAKDEVPFPRNKIDLYTLPSKVTKINVHEGEWTLIHVYYEMHPAIFNTYAKLPCFAKLFNAKLTDRPVLADTCATDNHPIIIRNKGRVTFNDVEVGDLLNEFVWNVDGKMFVTGGKVTRIEKTPFKGKVYDIKGSPYDHLLTTYLIGHLAKE